MMKNSSSMINKIPTENSIQLQKKIMMLIPITILIFNNQKYNKLNNHLFVRAVNRKPLSKIKTKKHSPAVYF